MHCSDVVYPASGLTGNLLRLPTLGVSFGFSSILELQVDGGFYDRLNITKIVPAPLSDKLELTGEDTTDVEDVVVATKIRVVSEGPGRPSFGIRLATKLPVASNESGLGLDTMDFSMVGLFGKTANSVRVVGNFGLGILSDPIEGDRQNDVLLYGLSIARALNQGLEARRRNQWPIQYPRRARSARDGDTLDDSRRPSFYARRSALRRRRDLRLDVPRSELRVYRRRDLRLPRLHPAVAVSGLTGARRSASDRRTAALRARRIA